MVLKEPWRRDLGTRSLLDRRKLSYVQYVMVLLFYGVKVEGVKGMRHVK